MEQKQIKILVVDDEEMIVTILDNYLSEKGYAVTGVHDASEAIRLIGETTFDIVFTDLMMPGVNGMELVKEIHTRNLDTKIIIFTGYASVDSAIDAVQQGVYDYIKKPFSLEVIGNILNHALEELLLKRENELLGRKNERMVSQITMLYDVSSIIYQVRDRQSAIEMLFDTLAESMQIRVALICEQAKDSSDYFGSEFSRLADKQYTGFKFTLDTSINGQMIMANEPTTISLEGDLGQLGLADPEVFKVHTRMIFIPIKYRGALDGFLVILEDAQQPYPLDDELTLLKILATQIAPIIGQKSHRLMDMLSLKNLEPARTMHELIKAELTLSDNADTPISFVLVRLLGAGRGGEETNFTRLREAWRNLITDQLGSDKRTHWAGIDTLLIIAVGGNPVGLDHHLASVRNELEAGKIGKTQGLSFSMAYAILTYPFAADSAVKIVRELSSRLFLAASEVQA